MELVLKDHEIAVCMDVLDFYARIFIGQYDEIDDVLSQKLGWDGGMETNRFERTLIYTAMRSLEIPELKGWELNGSLGIWNDATDIRAKNAYDMKQLIRYHDAWVQQSSGICTKKIERPVFYGNLPEMDCRCRLTNTGTEIMYLAMQPEQYQILQDAAEVYWNMLNYRIRKMMQYYTGKKLVLDLAEIAERLYDMELPGDDSFCVEHLEQIRDFVGKVAGRDVLENGYNPVYWKSAVPDCESLQSAEPYLYYGETGSHEVVMSC